MTVEPAPLVASAVAGSVYLSAARRVAGWPRRRTAAWLAGLVVLCAALASPLHARGGELLSAHMAQHLLLTLAAAPLLVAGVPHLLVLRSTGRRTRRVLASALRGRPARTLVRAPVALALFAAVTLGTHVPGFYGAALERGLLHDAQHALYLGSALVFWVPLVGGAALPGRLGPAGRVAYLIGGMPAMAAVGAWLVSSDAVRYPAYAEAAPAASALGDQRLAGTIMWAGGGLLLAAWLLACAWQALAAEERRARTREEHAERSRVDAPPAPAEAGP